MVDLDPRYLQAFFEVARARSFSRAATALHKTQPAVSYQIRQLEQQLQASLFDRTTRRLTVTGAGALLLTLCERFFGEFEQLATMLRDPTAIAPPLLRIASVSGFGRYVLFPILARMPALQRYSLRYPTADQVFQSLHEGSCDLGFVYLPIVSSRLLTTAVWREELVLLAPARSRFPASIAAFTELPFVTYDESEYVFGKWFETLYGRSPRSLHSAYHFEELEEVTRTVAAGRGWSILPADCAENIRGTVILRHRRRRVHNVIYAVTRAGATDHPATSHIVEALRVATA
ncbi:MAG: LysR family transcriptional regulator [Kofleriaceae bacterium]